MVAPLHSWVRVVITQGKKPTCSQQDSAVATGRRGVIKKSLLKAKNCDDAVVSRNDSNLLHQNIKFEYTNLAAKHLINHQYHTRKTNVGDWILEQPQ